MFAKSAFVVFGALLVNPNKPSESSHPYQLDESTFIFRGIRSDLSYLFHFSMKFLLANRKAQDWTPSFAASPFWLFCLPVSQKVGKVAGF